MVYTSVRSPHYQRIRLHESLEDALKYVRNVNVSSPGLNTGKITAFYDCFAELFKKADIEKLPLEDLLGSITQCSHSRDGFIIAGRAVYLQEFAKTLISRAYEYKHAGQLHIGLKIAKSIMNVFQPVFFTNRNFENMLAAIHETFVLLTSFENSVLAKECRQEIMQTAKENFYFALGQGNECIAVKWIDFSI